MVDIIVTFKKSDFGKAGGGGLEERLETLWHLRSKSRLNIGQKRRKNARYNNRVFGRKSTFGLVSWDFVTTFGSKIIVKQKTWKNADILGKLPIEKKINLGVGMGREGVGENLWHLLAWKSQSIIDQTKQ